MKSKSFWLANSVFFLGDLSVNSAAKKDNFVSEQDGRESEIERVQKERELGNLPFAVAFSPRVAYRPQNDRRRGKIQTFFKEKNRKPRFSFALVTKSLRGPFTENFLDLFQICFLNSK